MPRILIWLLTASVFAIPTVSWEASISQNLSITVAATQAITALNLSGSSFTGSAPSGTVVGAISVTMSPSSPPFSGVLSLSGANASHFQIVGSNLATNGIVPTGSYQINIVATQPGASASPFTQPETITGSGSTGGGSLLPPDRDASANWRMAGMLSVGGIPNRTTQCGATINPRGGGQDDTPNVNNAVGACPVGQVVQLAAGTFTIAEGSHVSIGKGITLRGAGAGATILQRTNGAQLGSYFPGAAPSPIIVAGTQYNNSGGSTSLTADAAQGSNSVQVASTTGFSVGQIVLLDEASGAGWQPERNSTWAAAGYTQIWAAPDYRVEWMKHNPTAPGDDFGSGSYPYSSGSAGCWFSNCDRPTNEIKQIASISGNTITFDSPVTISYRVGQQAKLYYWQTPHVRNAGIENLTVSNGDDANIQIVYCAYCWAQNVENKLYLNDGFRINVAFRDQLEGVYIHDAVWPVNGGAGYNISLAWGASEILIENSISMLANKVMVDRSSGAGSVVAYNYMDDSYIKGSDGWVEIGVNASHMTGGHHVLFEGNQSSNADSDSTHGNSIYMTFFRDYLSGFRKPFTTLDGNHVDDTTGCCGPLRAGAAHQYSYWFSFIGNVLGTPGKMNGWVYEDDGGANRFPSAAIWTFGYFDVSPQGTDPNVAATAIRDGNYDYVTNAIHWATNDTAHTLPNSLYLSSKPAFFNAGKGYGWPWVDPINGTVATLPAKARIDAGTPFAQP